MADATPDIPPHEAVRTALKDEIDRAINVFSDSGSLDSRLTDAFLRMNCTYLVGIIFDHENTGGLLRVNFTAPSSRICQIRHGFDQPRSAYDYIVGRRWAAPRRASMLVVAAKKMIAANQISLPEVLGLVRTGQAHIVAADAELLDYIRQESIKAAAAAVRTAAQAAAATQSVIELDRPD